MDIAQKAEADLAAEHVLSWWTNWIAEGKPIPSTLVASLAIAAETGIPVDVIKAAHNAVKPPPWKEKGLVQMDKAEIRNMMEKYLPPKPSDSVDTSVPDATPAPSPAPAPAPVKAQASKSKKAVSASVETPVPTPVPVPAPEEKPVSETRKALDAAKNAAAKAVASKTKPTAAAAAPKPKAAPKAAAAPKPKAASVPKRLPVREVVSKRKPNPPCPEFSFDPRPDTDDALVLKKWAAREDVKASIVKEHIAVVLPHACPGCGLTADTFNDLLDNFGLRYLNPEKRASQSHCRTCRQTSSNKAIAHKKAQAAPTQASKAADQRRRSREAAALQTEKLINKIAGTAKPRAEKVEVEKAKPEKPTPKPVSLEGLSADQIRKELGTKKTSTSQLSAVEAAVEAAGKTMLKRTPKPKKS